MQIVIVALVAIFSATYLLVWISSLIKPLKADGTRREVIQEAGSISVKVFFVVIIATIGYVIWLLAFENNSGHKKMEASNIEGKWRSDEIILNLKENGHFEWHSFAGKEKNKKWAGSWKLDSGVLFLTFDDESTINYLVRSVNADRLTLELNDPERTYGSHKYYFDNVD